MLLQRFAAWQVKRLKQPVQALRVDKNGAIPIRHERILHLADHSPIDNEDVYDVCIRKDQFVVEAPVRNKLRGEATAAANKV